MEDVLYKLFCFSVSLSGIALIFTAAWNNLVRRKKKIPKPIKNCAKNCPNRKPLTPEDMEKLKAMATELCDKMDEWHDNQKQVIDVMEKRLKMIYKACGLEWRDGL